MKDSNNIQAIFEDDFVLSSTTLHELEHIKTSKNKDEETKYNARKAIHLLDEKSDMYDVVSFTKEVDDLMYEYGVFDSPDNDNADFLPGRLS